jgi:hypothetical protein
MSNCGHGHVIPNPNGSKARCGGPRVCSLCAMDQAALIAQGAHPAVQPLRRVILESPYAGDVEANVAYARRALRDSVMRGEAPIASHLLFTQPGVLVDDDPIERWMGINAGLAWGVVAQATVVYADRGISRGMEHGIKMAHAEGREVEVRYLDRAAESRDIDRAQVPPEKSLAGANAGEGIAPKGAL